MGTLWQDIRYALRMLRKSPGFTAIALVTLAIGIGANTIMFSVVNVLLFRPTQVKEPDRLVECHARNFLGGLPYTSYLDLQDDNQVFSDLVAFGEIDEATLAQGSFTRRILYMHVSVNYFSTLGVKPALGRPFLPEEEKPGAQAVAVLSHHLWKRQGSDPDVLGKNMLLNGVPVHIVGVAPAGFMGTSLFGPDLWVSWGCYGRVKYRWMESDPERLARMQYPNGGVKLIGRLKPGLSRSAAQTQLQALIQHLREQYPRRCTNGCVFSLERLSRLAPGSGVYDKQEQFYLFIISLFLMGVSGVVLIIACLNLANMLIIQGTARRREIAIRMAIGGGRRRIIRQLFVESLILAILGGALGLVVAFWGTRILNAWVASGQFPVEFATPLKTGLEMNVLAATLVFCMVAAILFGLRPALRLSRRDVITDLKESGCGVLRTGLRARWFIPRGLSVVCQIALSVVLVMGAALFAHSALKTAWLNYGFSLDGKLLVKVDPIAGGYDRARSAQVYENLTEHLKALPGIQTVALSSSFPLGEGGRAGGLFKEYEPGTEIEEPRDSSGPPKFVLPFVYKSYIVGVDYFKTMGIPLLRGRSFRRVDSVPDAEEVVIIDQRLARKLRPDGNALGCLIQYGPFYFPSPKRVIGIVPNLRTISDAKDELPCIYEPIDPDRLPANIHIRLAGNESAAAFVQRLSAEIRRFDPSLPIISVITLEGFHRKNYMVWATGLGARLAFVFGAMALFLASLGIYAVKGYMVASRTAEFGIRKALGATHGNIMGMVFREGLVLTIAGLIIGLLLGLGTARLIRSMLYGIDPVDPLSIAVAVILLGLTSMLASYIPAHRAAKVDPMEALRYE
ncbi:MAG: ABC transporter permease [Planctomycetota bacterium]|jgi:predicted permease